MNNAASILLLVFLALTFIQSAYEKLFYWQENVDWLKEHFAKTRLKNLVNPSLVLLVLFELISGVLCIVGIIELIVNNGRTFGFYGAIFFEHYLVDDALRTTIGQRL